MKLLEIEKIEKRFGKQQALHPLSLSINKGEIFGLLGHNGAGKSTTLGIILGHISADMGHVFISGHDVAKQRTKALHKTGAIFETPSFYDYLSADANLDYYTTLTGRVDKKKRESVIQLVGLSSRMRDKVGTFSHGMRQRLALAQALLPNPDLLLLDEPNDGLDPQGIIETREMIQTLREKEGKTILFSSHILSEVERLCDRIAILHRGRLVFCGQWQEAAGKQIRIHAKFKYPEKAYRILRNAGAETPELTKDDIYTLPNDVDLGALAASLCLANTALQAFTPLAPSLEDFYLRTLEIQDNL
ncbi:MAG: ABC transporter ATP-binding protein [Chthoniobacterales bacterium]